MTNKSYRGAPFDDNPHYEEFNQQGPCIEPFTRPRYSEEEIYINFSSNVRFLRRAKSLSQREFADKMKIDVDTVINWENCKELPPYTVLLEAAYYFGTTIHEMLTRILR